MEKYRPLSHVNRLWILIGIIVGSLIVWMMLWESFYNAKIGKLNTDLLTLQTKKSQLETQTKQMKDNLNTPAFIQSSLQLKKQIKMINDQLNSVSTQLISPTQMISALRSILQKNSELNLISLKNTGSSALKPEELGDKKAVVSIAKVELYRHDFEIKLSGSYLATLAYLKKLEEQPWQFYWDTMDYKVTQYPNAEVTLTLHTTSKEKGLLDEA